MQKTIIIIGLSAVVLVLGIMNYLFQRRPSKSVEKTQQAPTPTTFVVVGAKPQEEEFVIPGNTSEYKTGAVIITKKETELLAREEKVGYLIDELPHNGANVKITFDYNLSRYLVIIPKNKVADGNAEFDQFLKNNNIESRSWIRSDLLEIKYE